MQPLITICARKGSKGVPGKNTREFNGRPLIEWTIETAIEWGAGPIVISSDDEAVEKIFRDYMYCDIYFDERPEHLAQDDTPKIETLRYVADKTQDIMGNFDYVVDLDPTNPCRTVQDLENCRGLFEENGYKTLFSATNAKKNPFMNQAILCSGHQTESQPRGYNRYTTPCEPVGTITNRQQVPPVFDVNSCIYFYDTEWLQSDTTNIPFTDDTHLYIMPDWASIDIDNEVDFIVSEFLHREYYV